MKKYIFRYLLILTVWLSWLFGDVSGVVFRDLPMNGEVYGKYGDYNKTIEPGVEGVEVYGVDENGNSATAVTDESGAYTLKGLNGKVRVEFSNWPSYLKESVATDAKNSSVRFVNDGDSNINFGLHNPADYSSTQNPEIVTPVYFNGATSGDSGDLRSLVVWDYNNTTDLDFTTLAKKNQVGSLWGIAYDRKKRDIYAAAILKRHSGLLDNDNDGYGDIGVIYKINRDTLAVEEFYRFKNSEVGTIKNDANRDLPENTGVSTDALAFDKVGNIGLGDIEISPDCKTLYVTNLYDKKLYAINVATKKVEESVDIPSECADQNDSRPFALEYNDGSLYVGVTCVAYDSNNSNDLEAFIYRYKGNGDFEKVINVDLNYLKGGAYVAVAGDGSKYGTKFHPWAHKWEDIELVKNSMKILPQPLLTDIEFIYKKDKKYLIMSFLDRTGLQTGFQNADPYGQPEGNFSGITGGDSLVAVVNSDGSATLENNATVGNLTSAPDGNNDQGPGGGEFFYSDFWENSTGKAFHEEIIEGGAAYLTGSSTILLSVFDPKNANAESGGVRFFVTDDGNYTTTKLLYDDTEDGSQGKSVGLGDLELLTDLAPVEVGDRIWLDSNGNGVQDPNENGISGVKIQLICNGNVKAEAISDSDGYYLFSNDTNKVSNSSQIYSISDLQPQNPNNCKIVIPNIEGTNKQSALKNYILTKTESGEGQNPTLNDSNGKIDGNDAVALINSLDIAEDGANNHSFDFGFSPLTSLGSFIWEDKNKDGIQDDGENGISGVVVELLDENGDVVKDEDGNPITTTTDSDGKYLFTNLKPATYKIRVKVPSNYIPTNNQNSNADNDIENDSNIADGNATDGYISAPITLKLAEEPVESSGRVGDDQDDSEDKNGNMTLDLGFIKLTPLSIGSFIWDDQNLDGKQDSSESPVSGVRVSLLVEDSNGSFVKAKDINGKEVDDEITDNDGTYIFKNLPEGNYKVVLEAPSIYVASSVQNPDPNDNKEDDSNIASESNGKYYSGVIELKENLLPTESGTYRGDDLDDNDDKNGNMTIDFGLFYATPEIDIEKFTNDKDADDEIDAYLAKSKETIQWKYVVKNIGNEPLKDVKVVDDKEGDINCPKTTLDVNESMTCLKSGTASISNYENKATVTAIGEVSLKDVKDEDLSHYKILYSLGDFVWNDENKDGIQNSTEAGIANVKVELLDSNGTLLASTTTDGNGRYKFKNLENGTYQVRFYPPSGYEVTKKDQGNDDTKDSDADSNGFVNNAEIKDSDNFTIDLGVYKSTNPTYCLGDFVWIDANFNLIQDIGEKGLGGVKITLNETGATTTTDNNGWYEFCGLSKGDYSISIDKSSLPAGYIIIERDGGNDSLDSDIDPSTGVSSKVTIQNENNLTLDVGVAQPKYCLGDFIWDDKNKNGIQDPEEKGVKGIKITLNETGESVFTDENGKYQFCNLIQGEYSITIDKTTLPDGYVFTTSNSGSDDSKDSDIDPSNGQSKSIKIENKDIMTLDGGIYKKEQIVQTTKENPTPKLPKVDIEKHTNNKDADTLSLAVRMIEGDKITWEYIIKNIGEDTLVNIKVVDDKEGEISCPKKLLAPKEVMVCKKEGKAIYPKYQNTATVTATGKESQKTTSDSDSSWYTTKYVIGTHFWIDSNGDGIYQEGKEKPIPNALVELFDKNGKKIAQTRTNEKGEYRFLVDEGEYYVKFHLPEEFKKKGYVFDLPKENNDNQLNVNKADADGITKLVSVGPNADSRFKVENLTLDAGVNCGCDAPGIEQGSGDSLGKFNALLIILLSILLALREIEKSSKKTKVEKL